MPLFGGQLPCKASQGLGLLGFLQSVSASWRRFGGKAPGSLKRGQRPFSAKPWQNSTAAFTSPQIEATGPWWVQGGERVLCLHAVIAW